MGSPNFPHTPFGAALAFPGSSPAKAAAAAQLRPTGASQFVAQLGPMPPSVEAPSAGGSRVSPFADNQACPGAMAFAAGPHAALAAQQQLSCWAAAAPGGAGSSALLPGIPSTADLGVVRPHASLSLSLQPTGGRCSPADGSPMARGGPPGQPLRSVAELAAFEVVDAACTDTWDPKGRAPGSAAGSDASTPLPRVAPLTAELPFVASAMPALASAGPLQSGVLPPAAAAGAEGISAGLPGGDDKILSIALNMSWDFDLDIADLAGIPAC